MKKLLFCILIIGNLFSCSEGSTFIQVPSTGNCGEDTVLTCQVTGNIGYIGWYGLKRNIMTNGIPVRAEDNNKYTETKGESFFALTIHNTDITDAGDYRYRNGFDESSLKRLKFECKSSSATFNVTRGKKVQITLDQLNPASPTITITFERQNSAIQIPGSNICSSSIKYSGYYRCVWTSSYSLDDGIYTYRFVVTTITQASPLTGSFKIVSPGTPLISNIIQLNAGREVIYGIEGQPLTIQCTSNRGFPAASVTWYKESISNTNQFATTSSGILQSDGTYTVSLQHTFTPVESDDRKYLICRSYYPQADSAQVGSSSKSVLLNLTLKPSEPTVTQITVVSAGNYVTVRCNTTGCRPAASISWLYQGVRYIGSTTSTLDAATETFTVISTYTRHVTAADNGQSIQCIVTHPALVPPAQLAESINLNVQYSPDGPPTIQNFNNGTTCNVIENVQNSLPCSVIGGKPLATLSWTCFNSGFVSTTVTAGSIVKKIFTFSAFRGQDRSCTCKSSHPVAGTQSVTVNVQVMYPPESPRFKVNGNIVSSRIEFIEGKSRSVVCESNGKPNPNIYTWTKGGYNFRTGKTLIFNDIQRQDDSQYTCTAENLMYSLDGSQQTGTNSSTVKVSVLYPPKVQEMNDKNIVLGSRLNFSCPYEKGNPKETTFKWTRNGDNREWGNRILYLENVTKHDDMTYTCTARNAMTPTGSPQVTGEDNASFHLNILCKFSHLIDLFE